MVIEHALDLSWVNVLSACNHHVLKAVCDEQKTLLIEKTNVAGVKPTLRIDRRRRRVGIVPISFHDIWPAGDDLPIDPRRYDGASIRVDEPDFAENRCSACGSELRDPPLRREKRHKGRGFGQPITLIDRDAPLRINAHQRLRHWGAAADSRVQARKVSRSELRLLADEQQHRWDREEGAHAISRDVVEAPARIESPVQHYVPALLP